MCPNPDTYLCKYTPFNFMKQGVEIVCKTISFLFTHRQPLSQFIQWFFRQHCVTVSMLSVMRKCFRKGDRSMNRTAAVIAEFNPLHCGHRWFLDQVRKLSGARYILAVMSGDFVQRGVPAVCDKYLRTSMALEAGADAVIELPAAAATGSAGRFAEGAVAVLEAAGTVDELWFGSEAGDDRLFSRTAALLSEESGDFRSEFRRLLKEGCTWPAARMEALRKTDSDSASSGILEGPNNTLGLEYCLALRRAGSRIVPHTVRRMGEAHDAAVPWRYHEDGTGFPGENGSLRQGDENAGFHVFASASSLRVLLEETGDPGVLKGMIPDTSLQILQSPSSGAVPLTEDDLSPMLIYQLMKETPASLTRYLDLTEDLARRIVHLRGEFRSYRQFADLLKTRNTTRVQMNRALLHVLLGITPEDFDRAIHPKALRLLGFNTASTGLLTQIKANGSAPLLAGNDLLPALYDRRDLFASDLYEYVRSREAGQTFTQEFRHPVIRRE